MRRRLPYDICQLFINDIKIMKSNYQTPILEVIEVQVEQGYSASGNDNNGGGISAPGWG